MAKDSSTPDKSNRPRAEATRLIRAGAKPGALVRTVNPPIQRGSTVLVPAADALYDYSVPTYGREGLSAQIALIEALNALEGAEGTCLYPSGVSAITGSLLALLKTGDEVLVVDSVYAPTRRFCDKVLAAFGIATRYYSAALAPEALMALATYATKVIVLEAPGSLSFEMQDVPGIAKLARGRGIVTLIDNTYGAGLLFKPLAVGVDISIQSLTKYVGGHSDLFMGSASAGSPRILRRLQEGVLNLGWCVSPDDAYGMLRGIRTLAVRMEQHGRSALQVAQWLTKKEQVAQVLCPALPGAPGHELFSRDFSGPNGLFAIALQPAPEAAVYAFLDALELFGLGYSWGGFESLAINCDPQLKARTAKVKYPGPLVRLHIGLEDPNDLIADLNGGLKAFAAAAG